MENLLIADDHGKIDGAWQNYGFLHRKRCSEKIFLKTRNKVLTKCSSFLKLVRIFLLRINVPKLGYGW